MRFFIFSFLFLFSCSIKDKFTNKSFIEKPIVNSTFSKIDVNKDNHISQEEFIEFKNVKKLIDPTVDYKTPLIIFGVILLIIFSLCSITYIVDSLKKIYLYIKTLFVK